MHVGVFFLPFPLLFTPLRKESQFFLKLGDSQHTDVGWSDMHSGGRVKIMGGDREDTQALDARACATPVMPGEEVELLKAELGASRARENALRSELAACQARLGESEGKVFDLENEVSALQNPEPELYSHWNPDCVCQDQEVRHEEALERMEEEHSLALARVEGEHIESLALVEGEHKQALARVSGEYAQALQGVKAHHSLAMGRLREDHLRALEQQQSMHMALLESVQSAQRELLEAAAKLRQVTRHSPGGGGSKRTREQ
jgi:hypothetical protein